MLIKEICEIKRDNDIIQRELCFCYENLFFKMIQILLGLQKFIFS